MLSLPHTGDPDTCGRDVDPGLCSSAGGSEGGGDAGKARGSSRVCIAESVLA